MKDLRRQQKMERELGAAVTCDGRLFHRRAATTAKCSVADSGQTSRPTSSGFRFSYS